MAGSRWASLVFAVLLSGVGCIPPAAPPRSTVAPTPLPTRFERVTPAVPPTSTPLPTFTPAPPRVVTARDLDLFADLYMTERDGIFVTTRDPRGRLYYRWDDRRWMTIDNRVWFRTVDDLLTVFPNRIPAP